MRYILRVAIAGMLVISIAPLDNSTVEASAVHRVQAGDTLWLIGKKYGVSIKDIQYKNHKSGHLLYVGERLTIPTSVTNSEKELMARLVHAEAKGEPYAGKVAVATVVLNRVKSDEFPDTISDVIHQKVKHSYAFEPVQNGSIHQHANQEAAEAVDEAIAYDGMGNDSLYFYNPETATSKWIFSTEETLTIGKHRFAK
ncbi:LysM peptidoglycan-binding domain-containing protein [Bacillus lacus]|uniref:LysM peptidoglycan-binding domain-containing protein n=2 Tax=Metabacillus lacus TaxID=1983721 RepID=A0A7X2IYT0_9BACI|nr:cell wall hydrolase [Metabacillus lacus]MRX72285.1 LysM peptidoglycan-binding domain-containing protein [Metabacillus lacus]